MFKIERGKPSSAGDMTISVEAGEGKITVVGNSEFTVEIFASICQTDVFIEWVRRFVGVELTREQISDITREKVRNAFFNEVRRHGRGDLADRYEKELAEGAGV